jgi:hypothetical protein
MHPNAIYRKNLASIHGLSRNVTDNASSAFNAVNSHAADLAYAVDESGSGVLGIINQRIKKPFGFMRCILSHGYHKRKGDRFNWVAAPVKKADIGGWRVKRPRQRRNAALAMD